MNSASSWPVASSDDDFKDCLSGAPPDAGRMFWRFIELARETGMSTWREGSRQAARSAKSSL